MIIIAFVIQLFLCIFPTFTSSFILCNHNSNRNINQQQRLVEVTSNTIRADQGQRSKFCFSLSSTLDDENDVDNEASPSNDNNLNENDDEDEKIFALNMNIENDIDGQKDLMSELAWRTERVNLEEANTRAFKKTLKSRPWKLPYDDAVSK